MNEITTVIVDDLDSARHELNELISNHDDVKLVAEAINAAEGFNIIKKYNPDLVFLDICMEAKDSGIRLAKQVQKQFSNDAPFIVFMTAYNDHNIGDIVDVKPLCFINKPISPDEILDVITTVVAELKNRANFKNNALKKMKVAVGRNHHFINPAKDILYIEAYNNSTMIHLKDGRILKTNVCLRHYQEILMPINICRSHHGFIINLNKVTSVITKDDTNIRRAIIKGCEREVPVGTSFYKKILEKLDPLIKSKPDL